MTLEDKLPEKFKTSAYHPSLFIYAWQRNSLEKLFEEFLASNIAIVSGEAWIVEGEKTFGVIPLKNGDKTVLHWKIKRESREDWYDFVERCIKDSQEVISTADLEKNVTNSIRSRIYYHFKLEEEN